jgi:hypothetical protein
VGKTSTDVCLHAGKVKFGTPSEVRFSMRVTKCINIFDNFLIYLEQIQYANNYIKVSLKMQFTTKAKLSLFVAHFLQKDLVI